MKRRFFSIVVLTEQDRQFSTIISRNFAWFLVLLLGAIFILAGVGFWRLLGYDRLTSKLTELYEYRHHARQIISDLDRLDLLADSSITAAEWRTSLPDDSGLIPFTAPVAGYVTRTMQFDSLHAHYGVDIAAKGGDLIRAPADGMVVVSGQYSDLGNAIILAHAFGFFTVFGHNDTNLVRQRQWVNLGDPIARVGRTGETEGPHLHFEIWKNDVILDPREFIEEYKNKDVSIK